MRYMLLIYTKETIEENMPPEDMHGVMKGHYEAITGAMGKGILRGAEPLERTRAATTVRLQNGKIVITDGPFAETKEQIAGYYILDCANLDEAVDVARKIPTACGGWTGCVEVRPMRQVSPEFQALLSKANGG